MLHTEMIEISKYVAIDFFHKFCKCFTIRKGSKLEIVFWFYANISQKVKDIENAIKKANLLP